MPIPSQGDAERQVLPPVRNQFAVWPHPGHPNADVRVRRAFLADTLRYAGGMGMVKGTIVAT